MADIAINPVTRRVQFTGNTGTGPFAFTFNVLQASDIVVYKNNVLQTLTTDYTVTINANGTGSITLVSALVATDVLVIVGGRELSRTTDFVTSGDLLAASLNEQLDSNVIMSQQLDERISRALRVQPGDESADLYLPLKSTRQDKILSFDSAGNVTTKTASELTSGTVLGANYTLNTATGDGSKVAFGVTVEPGSQNNIQIYIDGVYQNKATFSISGSTVTFSEAPPLNAAIEFIIGAAVTSISGDADGITYTQGGTGSQQRTVELKLQEFVSVKDFGAVADGATDDGPAFNLALQAAHTLGKIVYVPAGNYRIDTTLVFDVGNKMHGEGRGDAIGDTEIKGSRLFGSANPMVKFVNVTSPGTATFGQEIIGCYLRGTNTGSQVGIQIGETSTSTNARNFTLRDFSIRNFNTNIEFQAASYQFEISNFVSRVSTNSTTLTVSAVNPATTYTVADASGFEVGDVVGIQLNTGVVHEATLTGVNAGSNLITVDTAVPSNAAIDNAVFLANKNIHINTTAGPTSGSIHSASIYNCFGVYWNGGGAPGISVHSIDFDTCDIAIYVSGDVKGPSLFRNISSEFTITSDIVCVATGAFVGVDGYYAHAGTCDQNRIRNTSTSTLLVNNAYVNTALIAAGKDAYSNESTGSLYVDGDSFPLNTQRLNGDVYAGVYGILESTTNTNVADNSSYIDLHSYKSVSFDVGSGANEDTFTLDMSDHRLGVFKVMIYDNNAATQIGEFNISKFNDTGNYDTVNDQSGRFTMTRVDANTYDLRTTNASATAAVVTVPSLCKVSRKA